MFVFQNVRQAPMGLQRCEWGLPSPSAEALRRNTFHPCPRLPGPIATAAI